MSTSQIRDLALQLPPQERAILACDLLDSLDANDAKGVESDWIDEIESRAEAYAAGEAPADDWQISLDRARRRLHEGRSR